MDEQLKTESPAPELCLDMLAPVTPDTRKQHMALRRTNRSNIYRFYTVKNRREVEAASDARKKVPPYNPPEYVLWSCFCALLCFYSLWIPPQPHLSPD
jgi:hypothetical protein